MYKHILIPTDGSELSKMALEEGVALAKALGARVTVVTVTTPFHVITLSPGMLTDTPERYKEHVTALASQYLDVAKNIAAAAGVACDVVRIEHEHPYKANRHHSGSRLRRDPENRARTPLAKARRFTFDFAQELAGPCLRDFLL